MRFNHRQVPDDAFLPSPLKRARKLAWILDEAVTIPVLKQKIGLDPVLGVIPGGGDVAMLLIACYMLWVALELNLPRKVMGRMVINIAIDYGISFIPLLGDVLDVAWKANTMNVELMEEAYAEMTSGHSVPDVVDVEAVDVTVTVKENVAAV